MVRSSVITLLKKQSEQQGLIGDGPTPLYHQLYTLLKDRIVDGTVSFGSQLPTEQELGEAFGLSRITVKRAMDELAAENLVERRRGRGTSVIYKYKPQPVNAPLVGMLENIASMRRHTNTRLIDLAEIIPPAKIRDELGVGENQAVTRMIRVRLTEGENIPFAYYVSWTLAPMSCFDTEELESKTRIALMREYGIQIAKIDQLLSAEAASPEIARELNLKVDSPLLVLLRRSYDESGQVVDILQGSYNPEVFQYQMSMSLDESEVSKA